MSSRAWRALRAVSFVASILMVVSLGTLALCAAPSSGSIVLRQEVAIRMIGQPKGTMTLVMRVPRTLVEGLELNKEFAAEIDRPGSAQPVVKRIARLGDVSSSALWLPVRLFGWTEDSQSAILITLPANPSTSSLSEDATRYDPQSTQIVDVEYHVAASGRLERTSIKAVGRLQAKPITWK